MNAMPGYGRGMGFGRGRGMGFAHGRGMGGRWGAPCATPAGFYGAAEIGPTPEQEAALLKNQADSLEGALAQIKQRLANLGSKA
jgi:hypothetical protein